MALSWFDPAGLLCWVKAELASFYHRDWRKTRMDFSLAPDAKFTKSTTSS